MSSVRFSVYVEYSLNEVFCTCKTISFYKYRDRIVIIFTEKYLASPFFPANVTAPYKFETETENKHPPIKQKADVPCEHLDPNSMPK